MSPFIPDLNSELLAEFESDARESYAALLSSLSHAAHPVPAHPGRTPANPASLDPLSAATRLRDCWVEAQLLAIPRESATARLPLPTPQSIGLLDNLLALAAYSGTSVECVEAAGKVLRRLSEVAGSSEAPAGRANPPPP